MLGDEKRADGQGRWPASGQGRALWIRTLASTYGCVVLITKGVGGGR